MMFEKFNYDKEIRDLNKSINKDYKLVLLEETHDDKACDWRRALLYGFGKCTTVNIYPSNINNNLYYVCRFIELLNEQKEPKMTREEAVKKCDPLIINASKASNLIACLEALGLIKFDEPKQPKYKYVFKSQSGNEYKVLDTFVRIEE